MRIAFCVLKYLLVGFGMLLIAIAILAAIEPARAQSEVVAKGVWCDKVEQVQRLFDLVIRKDKSLLDGVLEVNGSAKPPACAVSIVVILPGKLVARMEHGGAAYGVFEVMVLGFERGGKMFRLPQPMLQFGPRPLAAETSA